MLEKSLICSLWTDYSYEEVICFYSGQKNKTFLTTLRLPNPDYVKIKFDLIDSNSIFYLSRLYMCFPGVVRTANPSRTTLSDGRRVAVVANIRRDIQDFISYLPTLFGPQNGIFQMIVTYSQTHTYS